jgi:hypothetical protein
MADKQVGNKIRALKAKIAEVEAERNDWAEQVSPTFTHILPSGSPP